MNNIFFTSIDNGGGKTFISAGIAAVMQSFGYKTGVYKPIQAGAIDKSSFLVSPDLTFVKMLDPYISTHSTFMYKDKLIPAAAFEKNNITFDMMEIKKDFNLLSERTDTLLIESPGGLLTPLDKNTSVFHIPLTLNIPVVFIVNPSNNSLNHYLNEINTAKSARINIAGVIINKYPVYSDSEEIKIFPKLIEDYCDVKILGLVRNFRGKTVSAAVLINEILNGIDLEDLFNMKIPKLNGF